MRKQTLRAMAAVLVAAVLSVSMLSGSAGAFAEPMQPALLFPFQEGELWGYSDENGKTAIEPQFRYARDFSEGLAWVVTARGRSCIGPDARVRFVLSTADREVDFMMDFSEGLAWFSSDDKWGAVSREGKVVIEPKFDDAWPFSEGLARVNVGAHVDDMTGFPLTAASGGSSTRPAALSSSPNSSRPMIFRKGSLRSGRSMA